MGKKKLDDGEELAEAHAEYSSEDERLFPNEPLELVTTAKEGRCCRP